MTASDMSKCLVLWRLLLEYINLIVLRTFYGKLCACANEWNEMEGTVRVTKVHLLDRLCMRAASAA